MSSTWDSDCYWAKLASYAPWPARKCSKREEEELIRLQPGRGADHVAMIFCGTKNERAWVLPNCIYEFEYATFTSYFDARKFKNDKDYRLGVIEGVRINRERDFIDTDIIQSMIAAFKEMYPKKEDYNSGFCDTCGGSVFSGSLQICPMCKESGKEICRHIHDHCFMKDNPRGHLQLWVCDSCCRANHKKSGWTIPCKEETSRDKSTSSDNKKNSRKSAATSNEKASSSQQHAVSGYVPTTSSDDTSAPVAYHDTTNKPANLMKIVLDAVLQPNLHTKKIVHPPPESTKLSLDDVDDICFVCNEGGEVVLCDYPYCPKVYHQVCVAKLFPQPAHPSRPPAYEHPNSAMASSSSSSLHGLGPAHNSNGDDNEPEEELDTSVEWYCPRHFCSDCGALQTVTNIALDTLPLPPMLYESAMNARTKGESELIKERMLKQCKTCPFAMCLECEEELSDEFHSAFFYSPSSTNGTSIGATSSSNHPPGSVAARTRHSNTGSSSNNTNNNAGNANSTSSSSSQQKSSQQFTCLHCHEIQSSIDIIVDTDHNLGFKLKLAKCLEVAWMKMTTSRLALPFFRPLLPVPNAASTTNNQAVEKKVTQGNDLMSLLENIHTLKYTQIVDFITDLHRLTSDVQNEIHKQGAQDVLVIAIKTIISVAEAYLKGKKKSFELSPSSDDLPSTAVSTAKRQRRLSHELRSSKSSWWRVECHFHPLLYNQPLRCLLLIEQANSYHAENYVDLVLPRSMAVWRAYVKQGDDYIKRAAAWKEKILADNDDDDDDEDDDNDDDEEDDGNGKKKSSRKHKRGKKSNGKDAKLPPHEEALETSQARQIIRRTLRDVLATPSSSSNQIKETNIGNVYHMSRKYDYHHQDDETAARVAADLDAARLMVGMKNSALRDTVTLPFPSSSSAAHYDDDDEGHNGAMDVELLDPEHDSRLFHASLYDYHQTPIEDESLLIMKRLQEMTKQTLALQQQLQQEYLQRQRRVLDTGTEVIALGEVGIVTELKLSNDLLRHALQQREGLLKSSQRQVTALQQTVSEQRQLLDQLQAQQPHSQQPQPAVSSPSSSNHKRKRSQVQVDDEDEEF